MEGEARLAFLALRTGEAGEAARKNLAACDTLATTQEVALIAGQAVRTTEATHAIIQLGGAESACSLVREEGRPALEAGPGDAAVEGVNLSRAG